MQIWAEPLPMPPVPLANIAVFNVGLAGLGAGTKTLRNRSRKRPIAGIDFEKIGYNHAPVDTDLMLLKQRAEDGEVLPGMHYKLSPPSQRMRKDIQSITGVDTYDFDTDIAWNEITHIKNRHGKKGQADHSMADDVDFGKLQYILDNYDEIAAGKRDSKAFKNADGTRAKTIEISKRINGTYYVIEAVPDNKNKHLQIISAYKSKGIKNRSPLSGDVQSPSLNVRNELRSASNNSIAQNSGNVKAVKTMVLFILLQI